MNKLENRELDRMAETVASLQEDKKDTFNKLTDINKGGDIENPSITQVKKVIAKMGHKLEDITKSIEALKENK